MSSLPSTNLGHGSCYNIGCDNLHMTVDLEIIPLVKSGRAASKPLYSLQAGENHPSNEGRPRLILTSSILACGMLEKNLREPCCRAHRAPAIIPQNTRRTSKKRKEEVEDQGGGNDGGEKGGGGGGRMGGQPSKIRVVVSVVAAAAWQKKTREEREENRKKLKKYAGGRLAWRTKNYEWKNIKTREWEHN
ncbi:hypothetical protein PoB_005684700 [Plakobranchus ocellatus]|uniref:Uncharacterized protein n=1 Tax=Plakobranchus ocellatus TaxID=259542 RepID=A0AAV4CFH9_9GAST|nr:hypothetical protein PoB_005684700 [Plakobranchus ocellatus]